MTGKDHEQTRVIRSEEVLLLKPRCPELASTTLSPVSVRYLSNVCKPIPIMSCLEISHGGVFVKFPYGKAKADEGAFVGSLVDFMDVTITEPRKMLPKMTSLDVPPSLSDGEILSGIHEKIPKL